MSAAILDRLQEEKLLALRLPARDWPSSFLSAVCVPDAWMGLAITADGRRRYVPAGDDPKARDGEHIVLVRNRSIVVPLDSARAVSADGHDVSASIEMLVRWHAREDDLAALDRTLLADGPLTAERLASAVNSRGGGGALQAFARAHDAVALTTEDLRGPLLDALRDALKRFTFECGCTIDGVVRARFDSDSFRTLAQRERERSDRLQRAAAREELERASLAATHRRLDDLRGLLDKMKQTSAADDELKWLNLMPALSPAERARLLENLWRVTPNRSVTRAFVVVTGQECLWLDPRDPERIVSRVTLPEDFGGLRSVTFLPDANRLIVGAATGLFAIDPISGDVRTRYTVPDAPPQRTGFNAAAAAGERLLATHSGLGAWSWRLEDASDAIAVMRVENGRPGSVREATAAGDGQTLLFAADDAVYKVHGNEAPVLHGTFDAEVLSLSVADPYLYVATEAGELYRATLHGDDAMRMYRTRGPLPSVSVRRWSDLLEAVIPGPAGGIAAIFGDDGVLSRLVDSADPIRRVWASDDAIVGLTERCDALLVLNHDMPERAGRRVPVARLTSRSIQDACLVTAPA